MTGTIRAGQTERDLRRETKSALDLLALIDDSDEVLALDMIEGETSMLEAIERALAEMDEALALSEGVKTLMARYAERKHALDRRADRIRAAIEQAMATVDMKTIRLPAATLTLKETPPKMIVESEADIPAEFWKPAAPVLDRAALNEAAKSRSIPGVVMSNGGQSLMIRRK